MMVDEVDTDHHVCLGQHGTTRKFGVCVACEQKQIEMAKCGQGIG